MRAWGARVLLAAAWCCLPWAAHAANEHVATGRYVGDGSGDHKILGLGFKPELVLIKGDNGQPAVLHSADMPNDRVQVLGAAVPWIPAFKSLDADGFSVKNDASVNQNGTSYTWTAFRNVGGHLALGTYTGDLVNNRQITVGFRPDYVLLWTEGQQAVQRFANESGDAALDFAGDGELSNVIVGLNGTSFRVGTDPKSNGLLTDYYYAAWDSTADLISSGFYNGNGADDRSITGFGLQPLFAIVARRQAGSVPVWGADSLATDTTLPLAAGLPFADGVQRIAADGLVVGTDARVNALGSRYYWTAFQNVVSPDLSLACAADQPVLDEGDTLRYTVRLTNVGLGPALGASVTVVLPSDFLLVSSVATQGSFDSGAGVWSAGDLAGGDSARVVLIGVIKPGAGGTVLTQKASVISLSTDLDPTNQQDSTFVRVTLAELDVHVGIDDLTPVLSQRITRDLLVRNAGPDSVTGLVVRVTTPGMTDLGSVADHGAYNSVSGLWTIGFLAAGDSAALTSSLSMNGGTAGTTLITAATPIARDEADHIGTNDADSVAIDVHADGMRLVTGSYVGDGVAGHAITGIGFAPDLVVVNPGSLASLSVARTKSMTGDLSKELGAPNAPVAGLITSVDRDGFTLGASPSVNQSGVVYFYSAFLETPGQLRIGSYVGTGADNQSVVGVGFQPVYLMVLPSIANSAVQRYAQQTGDATVYFQGVGELADRIQRFESDGFQVGTSPQVNTAGVRYHIVAFAGAGGLMGTTSYTGDGADDRALSLGFRPHHLFVTRKEAGTPTVWRNRSVPGDLTIPASAVPPFTNGLQSLDPGGFQIGSDVAVNNAGDTYYVAGVRDPIGADIGVATSVSDPAPNERDTLTLTTTLTNLGYQNGATLVAHDLLPAGLTLRSSSATQGFYNTGSGSWTVGAIANGASATLTLVATVNAGTGGTTLYHIGSITGALPTDLFASNDLDSTAIVVRSADLSLQISVDDFTPVAGERLTWLVRLDNAGPDSATTIVVADSLPAGFTYQSHTASQGAWTPATGAWSAGTIAPGGFATLSVTAQAPGAPVANVAVRAHVQSADQADPTPANGLAATTVDVLPAGMRVVSGAYVGNGSAGRAITGLGFQPDLVIVNAASIAAISVARTKWMSGDMSKELGAVTAPVAGRITSLDRDGFTVGANASVNQNSAVYFYTAFLETPGQMKTGTYAGDGADNRSITGVGFQPVYTMVLGTTTNSAVQRYAAETGDASVYFQGVGELTDRIQRFEADGFQVGTQPQVNAGTATYYWAAFAATPGLIGASSYTGNGADDRELSALGFRPHHLFVTRKESGVPGVMRNRSVPGDLTLPMTAATAFGNGVQKLEPLGFQVGTDATVNNATSTYYVAGFRDPAGADVGVATSVSDATPDEGDTLTLTLALTNFGYQATTSLQALDRLPSSLTLRSSVASQGVYTPGTGAWDVGVLANGATATLTLVTTVNAGSAGTSGFHAGSVTAIAPADPYTGNDADSTAFTVPIASLELSNDVDDQTPVQSEPVSFAVRVENHGPGLATNVVVVAPLPANLAYQSSAATRGGYNLGAASWTVDSIAAGQSATLTLTAVAPAAIGAAAMLPASIVSADQSDSSLADNADSSSLTVHRSGFRLLTGSYVGNGVAGRAISGLGFQPDLLVLKGSGTTAAVARTKYMTGDATKPLSGAAALSNNDVTSLDPDGFTVGADASVNQAGITYYWSAFLETAGQMKVGSYVGTGADNRNITGVGFTPGYALVLGAGAQAAVQRFAGEANDASLPFQSGAEVTDRIQRFQADGFQVGTNAEVNASGTRYYYVTWNAAFDRVRTGIYIGNAVDDRLVTGVGVKPKQLVIKRLDAQAAFQRTAAMPGDTTLPFNGAAALPNAIQGLANDAFQIGTDAGVNASGRVYFWTAIADLPSLDLVASQAVDDATPNVGDVVTFTVTLRNTGPDNATGVAVSAPLPAGLVALTHLPSLGVYDPSTGVWTLGSVVSGDSATLAVSARVDTGTTGMTLARAAAILSVDQTDADNTNDQATTTVRVQSADLAVRVSFAPPTPVEGDLVTFTVSAIDRGPDSATTVRVTDLLPSGLDYQSSAAGRGTYDSLTGVWTVGGLAPGDSVALAITALVHTVTGNVTLVNRATLAHADQADPSPGGESDSALVIVPPAPGILIVGAQDTAAVRPGRGPLRLLSLTLSNTTTQDRVLQQLVVANLTRGAGSASRLDQELGTVRLYKDQGNGAFDSADTLLRSAAATGGALTFDSLAVRVATGATIQIHLAASVPLDARDGDTLDVAIAGAAQAVFDQSVPFLQRWPVSPGGALAVDGMAKAQLAVIAPTGGTVAAGATRRLAFHLMIPANGYEADALTGLHLVNLGSAVDSLDVARVDLWGDGSNGAFDAGAPDDFPLGRARWDGTAWSLTGISIPIPLAGRRVFASVDIAASATFGRTIALAIGGPSRAGIDVASGNDGPVDSVATAGATMTIGPGPSAITLTASQSGVTLLPGASPGPRLSFLLVNKATLPETLTTLRFTNTTSGTGTATQLDQDWQKLALIVEGQTLSKVSFASGRATFSGLSLALAAGDTLHGEISSGASLAARDGDLLDLSIAAASDVVFKRAVQMVATFPVSPAGNFPVDGMSAAQIQVGHSGSAQALTGSIHNLALEVVVPPNGYAADSLSLLLVRNNGDAAAGTDISKVEAWVDDGDGSFEPGIAPTDDHALGAMTLTGGGWALNGLAVPVPLSGLRVFFSCDIGRDANENRTVRLLVPSTPIGGIGMASPNDGPRDLPIESPVPMTISTLDRVTLATQGVPPGTAAPGDTGLVLLHVIVGNSYRDSSKTLAALTVANLTSGLSPVQSDLDGEVQSLELRRDSLSGPVLGRSFFTRGTATFAGLGWTIAPQESRDLYVVAKLGASVTDGDLISATIPDEASLVFAQSTSLAARFPLSSDAAWRIDGMIARQIVQAATPDTTLAPNEGPVPALDWIVPRNGYSDDVLEAVRLVNVGTATPSDLTEMHLWKDGGDGRFDAGQGGDDHDLGRMGFANGRWSSAALTDTIYAAGIHLYASITSSADPGDSSIVQLSIPVDGIGVMSDNDGPRDVAVVHANRILFSRSRLLGTVELLPSASVIGDTITARMTVRNTGTFTIANVVPSALIASGTGAVHEIAAASPASLDLAPLATGLFVWKYVADSAGTVQLTGFASGDEVPTGFVHRSLTVTTADHTIFAPAQSLNLYPVELMPFSVNRGQTQVVPLNLTLSHPGTAGFSDILVQRLTVRVEDEFGSDIAPANLLSRVVLNEGANVYGVVTTFPATGATFDLLLTQPLRLVSGGTTSSQVTLSLSLDLSDSTTVPSFRIAITDSAALLAVDATNGATVAARLTAPQSYPILTGIARVVAGGTELDVAGVADTAHTVGRGQSDVTLLGLVVENPGPVSLGPDVRLSDFDVFLSDTTGAPLASPSSTFGRVRVANAGRILFERVLGAADSATIHVHLSPPLTVPINTPMPLAVTADVLDTAPLGALRASIEQSESFTVRNASTATPIPTVLATTPILGAPFTVEAPADTVLASRLAAAAPSITIGATDVSALTLRLAHPGAPGTAAIVCRALTIRCKNSFSQPVAPDGLVDRAQILSGGVPVGITTDVGSLTTGFVIPLQGVTIAAGQSVTLELTWSVVASALSGRYEMSIAGDGIDAIDHNLLTPVAAAADTGSELPLSSGYFELAAPARELAAGFVDEMPAALVADGRAVPIAKLTLRNRAPAGEIFVDRLEWNAAAASLDSLPLGGVATRLEAWVADTLWGATDLNAGDGSAVVVGSSALSLLPGPATEIEMRMVSRTGTTAPFRVGCRRDDIGVVQPGSPLLHVSVTTEEGRSFPFWTAIGSLDAPTLKESYSNFPNPFAAGRQTTSFVYYLPTDAVITLSIWTAVGDKVATLLSSVSRAPGLHQEDRWDGRNGAGHAVVNGVYVAELIAHYPDGKSERILRKVAVAR